MMQHSIQRLRWPAWLLILAAFFVGALMGACSNVQTPDDLQATKPISGTESNAIDPTKTPTFAGKTPTVEPTSTSTPTPSPALSARLSYVTFQFSDNGTSSHLWMLESPYQTPKEILSLNQDDILFSSTTAWSHDGQYIAYTTINNSYTTIHAIDIDNLEIQDFGSPTPPELFGPETYSVIEVLPNGWSFKDKWLAGSIRYTKEAYGDQWEKAIIYNVKTGETLELSETYRFVAWSPTNPDQFLYIEQPHYPNLENQSIHVGQVGQTEPIHTIRDIGIYLSPWMSWSPDGTTIIAVSPNSSASLGDQIVLIDINSPYADKRGG